MTALLYIALSVICAGCALERIYAVVRMAMRIKEVSNASQD